jgi:shikimate dehydrogenase
MNFDMTLEITGSTRILGIIGDPITQVRAPEVWTSLFQHNGIDAVCIPMQVTAAGLNAFLQGAKALRNFAGLIITIPHKPASLSQVGSPSERARHVGAVNVVKLQADGQWAGDILDGIGFVKGLESRGPKIAGRRALVVGTGGVGTAIAFAIAEAGASEVAVFDISADRAADVARRISATGVKSSVSAAVAKGFDLIVNASPMGMKPEDAIPIDLNDLQSSTVVADVVVHPRMTRLLMAARDKSCFVQPGTHMMDAQIATMATFFEFGAGDWSPEIIAKVVGTR